MTKEQIRLIAWMYYFSITEMKAKPDKFFESDQVKLTEAIQRRFPEHAEEIFNNFSF